MDIGPGELLIVLALLLLLFGGSRLPSLARGLGSAMHEFRRGVAEGAGDDPTPDDPTRDDATD
jgi:sec-independent protein translocase protein TatA